MCGRYTVNTEDEVIEMRDILQDISLRLSGEASAYDAPDREAYPSCLAPIITPERQLSLARWGFEKWDGRGVVFNARSETVIESRFFSRYLLAGRCIVPARSYFEWIRKSGRPTDKYRIYAAEGKFLYMAGLMRPAPAGSPANAPPSYVVLTRPAMESIRFIHDRMPLVLLKEQVGAWLSPRFDPRLLAGAALPIAYEQVS